MGKKSKSPNECVTAGDFDSCLERAGAITVRQSGSHVIRRLGRFIFVYPWHGRNQRLSPGVRHQLVELMLAAGIRVIILAFLLKQIGVM